MKSHHGAFQYKMTIRAHVLNYHALQSSFKFALNWLTKQNKGGKLYQHRRLRMEVTFNTFSKISIGKLNRMREGQTSPHSTHCKWRKNPPGEQVDGRKQNSLKWGWLTTAEAGMEVDVGQPPPCQALGKYRGASLLRVEANGSLPAQLILREPGAASRRKAATAGSSDNHEC